MGIPELSQKLLQIHVSVFQFGIQHAKGRTQLPIFSQIAPGHLGADSIEVPNLNLSFEEFPAELQAQVVEVLSSGRLSKSFPLRSSGLNKGVVESFLDGLRHIFLLSSISDPLNRYHNFLINAEIHASNIADWLENGTSVTLMQLVIDPRVDMGSYTSFGDWKLKNMSLADLSLEGYNGLQSNQEALERVVNSSFFERDIKTLPKTPEEILAEVDVFALSLWLATRNVFRVQDVRFNRSPWAFSPDEFLPFGLEFQPSWDNPRENSRFQFLLNPSTSLGVPKVDSVSYPKILQWMGILSRNQQSIYSFNLISDGERDIARSFSQKSFRKDRMARDGMQKLLSGLEGLNTECKPLSKKGDRVASTQTFKDCWVAIFNRVVASPSSKRELSRVGSAEDAFGKIYDLRSSLAHSDPTNLPFLLKEVKVACGDFVDNGQYDAVSTSLNILRIVRELIEFFLPNESVLTELLNGKKPS